MAIDPLDNDAARAPARLHRTEAIDPVQALIELGEGADPAAAGGLAGQLLAWIAPRPRNPASLTQSRIAPLLSVAADMLTRASNTPGEIVGSGTNALVQELRMIRALADRRATLVPDGEQ
jgi:hypothetical protein